jgi:hypothetical protein
LRGLRQDGAFDFALNREDEDEAEEVKLKMEKVKMRKNRRNPRRQ